MKKRRSWKFSEGGGALFFLILLVPSFVGLARRWPSGSSSQWWAWPVFLTLLVFLAALLWFISLSPLIRQHLWTTPRTWYEACLGIAALYMIFALFTFVTGYAPSKFNSHPVPRSSGFIFLYWALVPLVVGSITYFYDKYSKPGRRR